MDVTTATAQLTERVDTLERVVFVEDSRLQLQIVQILADLVDVVQSIVDDLTPFDDSPAVAQLEEIAA